MTLTMIAISGEYIPVTVNIYTLTVFGNNNKFKKIYFKISNQKYT